MNIHSLLSYKVVECDAALVIVPGENIVNMPGASNLIVGPMTACCEYVRRYTEARADGKEVKAAHEIALRGAEVIRR